MTCQRLASVVLALCGLGLTWQPCGGQEPIDAQRSSAADRPDQLAAADHAVNLALEVIDLVLEHHLDPPARQQMLLDGVRALYQWTDRPLPPGFSRRVSGLAGRPQERELLIEVLKDVQGPNRTIQQLEAALCQGLLSSVHGETGFVPAKEARVQEQIRSNRYVGIGVALGGASNDRGPTIERAFPQGVAHQAGIKKGDQIIEIDGVSTQGKKLEMVVDLVRGAEGSTVRLLMQRNGEADPLAFSLRRSVLHFETVLGYRRTKEGAWDFRTESEDAIAYVQIAEIRPSTLHELRQVEQRLRSLNLRGLILDLRVNSGGGFHDTLLVADGLLPEGPIGGARGARGESQFKSGPDCLFRDWPLAVLIDSNTKREAEWLAAALQDGRKAILVGAPTPGEGYSLETVPLPSGQGAIQLWTKVLQRADGHSLLHAKSEFVTRRSGHRTLAQTVDTLTQSRPASVGVTPDVKVIVGGDWTSNWISLRKSNSPEEVQGSPRDPPFDPQFQEALRILREKI